MNPIVRRAVLVGSLATIGAGTALFLTSGARSTVVDVYLLAVGGVLLLALVRAARALEPTPPGSPIDQALAAMRAGPRQSGELALAREVELSHISAFHFHLHLRPVLQEIAADRLLERYGVELMRERARARELVPAQAWAVVDPDRQPPGDRLARGPSVATLRAVIEELERL